MKTLLLLMIALFCLGDAVPVTSVCFLVGPNSNQFQKWLCTFYDKKKVCNRFTGDCWCAATRYGQAYPVGEVHAYDEVDCVETFNYCGQEQTYQLNGNCPRRCEDPVYDHLWCGYANVRGCNCPPDKYLMFNIRCVSFDECVSSNATSPNNPGDTSRALNRNVIQTTTTSPLTLSPSTSSIDEASSMESRQLNFMSTSQATTTTEGLRFEETTLDFEPIPNVTCDSTLNEVYVACASACDGTCNQRTPNCSSSSTCTGRCVCADGRVRNANNVCVEPSQCPVRDTPILSECLQRLANNEEGDAFDCDQEGFYKTMQCKDDECFCINKYTGEVLTATQAPRDDFAHDCTFLGDCPAHMIYSDCSTTCPPTCSNSNPRCTRVCAIDCKCDEGMVRVSSTNTTCVPLEECPASSSPPPPPPPLPNSCLFLRDITSEGFQPDCNAAGEFRAIQCYNQQCWCVDEDGLEIPESRNISLLSEPLCLLARSCQIVVGMVFTSCGSPCEETCSEPNLDCSSEEPCLPRCQCLPNLIFDETEERCVPVEDCSVQSDDSGSDCLEVSITLQSELGLLDAFIPECDANGYYNSKQCYGFLNECWCVDKTTGIEKIGSRAQQFNPNYNVICDNYTEPTTGSPSFEEELAPPPPPSTVP